LSINDLIQRKIDYITDKTGNIIRFREENNLHVDACLDFGHWTGQEMTHLPWILYRPGIDKVHILHELIHLEKFFIDRYSLIATNSPQLYGTMEMFKNIPEDYVAHKIIFNIYGYNPIDRKWFKNKDSLGYSVNQIAANLVNYFAFVEFCPEFVRSYQYFHEQVRERNNIAFNIAERTIEVLKHLNVNDQISYNECADELIKIFAPNFAEPSNQSNRIYTAYLIKTGDRWKFNR
jgi:hypothetical protein